MLLCTSTDYLSKVFSLEEALKILSDSGYKCYDFTLYGKNGARVLADSENWREKAQNLRKYADGIGIACTQAHAYFHSSTGDENTDAEIFKKIVHDMEIASILGAEIIAVHPKQHLKYAENSEKLFHLNVKFYKDLIPYCKKFGIKVAMENMFQWDTPNDRAIDSTCSQAEEFCKYIDAVDSEWIVALLDVGHTALVNADLSDFIRKLGTRLKALHVHDNDKRHDCHTLPFTGNLDFGILTQALADANYNGNFTYEADCFLQKFPNELLLNATEFMRHVGDYLVKEIERKNN